MDIREISDLPSYEQFLLNTPLSTIHQSFIWASFQKNALGTRFFMLGAYDPELLATILVTEHPLPAGKLYFYANRGPVFNAHDSHARQAARALIEEVSLRAKKQNCIYLRIDPPVLLPSPVMHQWLKDASFIRAHVQHQPERTLRVDLLPAEDALLEQMKPKGRYNIKIAKRHGVTVRESTNVGAFYHMLEETTKRDKFHGHTLQYYQALLDTLKDDVRLYFASYQERFVASAIVTYRGDTATYYYGASSSQHRNVMAPYLLHWELIRDAKQRGFHWYDFFGIAPTDDPHHPWASITDFKRKFGGEELDYVGAWERIFQPVWYAGMRSLKKLRKQ